MPCSIFLEQICDGCEFLLRGISLAETYLLHLLNGSAHQLVVPAESAQFDLWATQHQISLHSQQLP
jgi:hypothetical protein